jgi:ribosomal protein S17E
MRSEAVAEYGEQFDKIKQMKNQIDITPIKDKIVKNLHDSLNVKFEIKQDPITGEVTRNVNYNNQPLPQHQINNVKKVVDLVENWDDLTPKGVDYLKRQIDNFYMGNRDSRQYDRFINGVRNSAKEVLTKNVPQYSKMTQKYAKFTEIEEEIGRALSLDDKAMVDTGLRKLMSTMRENFEWRKNLVQKLDEVSHGELLPKIAGYTMQSYMPKGLVGKLEMGTGAMITYLHGIDPILATALAMSSPRLSGEFIYMLGKAAKALNKIPKGNTGIETGLRQGLFQTGRTQKEMERIK